MQTWQNYTYYDDNYFVNAKDMMNEVNNHSGYDIALVNSKNGSFLNIKESGSIEMLAGDMLGIKIDKDNNSVNINGGKVNINGEVNIAVANDNGKAEIKTVKKTISESNICETDISADYISIIGQKNIYIGSPKAYFVIDNDKNTIYVYGDNLEIDSKSIDIKSDNITYKSSANIKRLG